MSSGEHKTSLPEGKSLLFYDGVCGFCNRLNRFVIGRDHASHFVFAPLQSDLAAEFLAGTSVDPTDLDSVVLVTDLGTARQRTWSHSAAVFELLRRLGGGWRLVAMLRVLPGFLTDLAYRLFAKYRYRIYGRYDACPIPSPEQRGRYLA